MVNYVRQVFEWRGKAQGWVLRIQERIEWEWAVAPSQPPCVPSSVGLTAGCTVAGMGTPYLWEVWWRELPATWGGGKTSYSRVASGGNW